MAKLSPSKDVVTQNTMTSKLYDHLIKFFFWQKEPKIARNFEQGLGEVNKGFKPAIINGQRSGDISIDKDSVALADFLTGLFYCIQAMGSSTLPNQNSLNHIISNVLSNLD